MRSTRRRIPDGCQMNLFVQPTTGYEVTLPKAIVEDLVGTLAHLILEAAGVQRDASNEEAPDESEDHS